MGTSANFGSSPLIFSAASISAALNPSRLAFLLSASTPRARAALVKALPPSRFSILLSQKDRGRCRNRQPPSAKIFSPSTTQGSATHQLRLPKQVWPLGDVADDTFDSLPVHLEGVRILPLLSEFVEPTCASALIMRLDQK